MEKPEEQARGLSCSIDAVVDSIGREGYNAEIYRVGLSDSQMRYLKIKISNLPPLTPRRVKFLKVNKKHMPERRDSKVLVQYDHKSIVADVYHTGVYDIPADKDSANRIVLSGILAEALGVNLQERVIISSRTSEGKEYSQE